MESFLDSEPPARAILCVREIKKEWIVPFTENLLEKEFIFGKNNSLDEVIFETIQESSIDETIFKKKYLSEEMREKVPREFRQARIMTSGFPTLFLNNNNQLIKLASGYAPMDRLIKRIEVSL